jgi:hypothetical protein
MDRCCLHQQALVLVLVLRTTRGRHNTRTHTC